jgi:hypothetical protein
MMEQPTAFFSSKTQNAVPHWAFELNSAPAAAEILNLKGHILISVRMW